MFVHTCICKSIPSQRHIQDKRKLDDQLTYEINVNLPTQSFREQQKVNLSERCKDIYYKVCI